MIKAAVTVVIAMEKLFRDVCSASIWLPMVQIAAKM